MSRKQNIVIKKYGVDKNPPHKYMEGEVSYDDVAGFQIAEGFFMVISHNGDVKAIRSADIISFTVENIGE